MNTQAICIGEDEAAENYDDLKIQYMLVSKADIVGGKMVDLNASESPFTDRIKQKCRILSMIEKLVPSEIIEAWQEEREQLCEAKRTNGIRWF